MVFATVATVQTSIEELKRLGNSQVFEYIRTNDPKHLDSLYALTDRIRWVDRLKKQRPSQWPGRG